MVVVALLLIVMIIIIAALTLKLVVVPMISNTTSSFSAVLHTLRPCRKTLQHYALNDSTTKEKSQRQRLEFQTPEVSSQHPRFLQRPIYDTSRNLRLRKRLAGMSEETPSSRYEHRLHSQVQMNVDTDRATGQGGIGGN